MRDEARPWWVQAVADITTANDSHTAGHWYNASWLAHQAAEKALKAVHVERSASMPPRTHSIVHLGVMLAVPRTISDDLGYLNPAFDLARYPDPRSLRAPVEEIDAATAERDVEAAKRVLAWRAGELGV